MDLWIKQWQKYKDFILKNPELTGELESGFKWTSYLLTSRNRGSAFISELTYCTSNLLVLINDLIFEQYVNSIKSIPSIPEQTIRKFLTVLNCVEVLAEITSRIVAGSVGKWIVITCIQIIKTICRLVLLLKYKVGVIPTLTLPFLNRRAMVEYLKKPALHRNATKGPNEGLQQPQAPATQMTFTLQSSGRTVRTIAAAPSSSPRTWKLPETDPPPPVVEQDPLKLAAELIYSARPLAHLMTMGLFGQKSWKPWLLALGMDYARQREQNVHYRKRCVERPLKPVSDKTMKCAVTMQRVLDEHPLQYFKFRRKACLRMLIHKPASNLVERREIQQRKMLMLFYLLRSPFYDKYSKQKILWVINCLRRKISLGNILWNPLADYAEKWDKMYFYSWDP